MVMVLSLINLSSIKLPFMKYYNLEEFSMQPLVGWRFVLATLKPVVLVFSLAEALLLLYVALRTLDENFPDHVDVVFHYVALVAIHSILTHVFMVFKDALFVPKEVYRLIKDQVVKVQVRRTTKVAKRVDSVIPIPGDSPPPSPRGNFLTIRFENGPLGITLAEVRGHSRHRAFVRFKPTGQAARGDVLRQGDSIWRINKTVVTGCSFRDIINIISAVPRPFLIDFVRPVKKLDLGHTTVYNNIQFDMVRVDGAHGETKLMPAQQLKSVTSMGSIRLKTKSFANLLKMRQGRIAPSPRPDAEVPRMPSLTRMPSFLPARSFHSRGKKYLQKKHRRVALPPLNRMDLNEKQQQWGIPVYSVSNDEGSGQPLPSHVASHLPAPTPGDARRLSVAL